MTDVTSRINIETETPSFAVIIIVIRNRRWEVELKALNTKRKRGERKENLKYHNARSADDEIIQSPAPLQIIQAHLIMTRQQQFLRDLWSIALEGHRTQVYPRCLQCSRRNQNRNCPKVYRHHYLGSRQN